MLCEKFSLFYFACLNICLNDFFLFLKTTQNKNKTKTPKNTKLNCHLFVMAPSKHLSIKKNKGAIFFFKTKCYKCLRISKFTFYNLHILAKLILYNHIANLLLDQLTINKKKENSRSR